jgi:hypothetical protein
MGKPVEIKYEQPEIALPPRNSPTKMYIPRAVLKELASDPKELERAAAALSDSKKRIFTYGLGKIGVDVLRQVLETGNF